MNDQEDAMTGFDVALVLLIGLGYPAYDYFWDWPRIKRRLEGGDSRARLAWDRSTFAVAWVFAVAVRALFVKDQRPLAGRALGLPRGWRLAAGALFVLVAVSLMTRQSCSIAASLRARERVRTKTANVRLIFPRTALE